MPGGASTAEVAETIGREIHYSLPEDSTVPSSINSGIPAAILDPRSRFSAAVKAIVGELLSDGTLAPERDRERRFRLLGIGR
jgi:MinD-like ATPase involved in chromosome partitioning or flagellar assembly